MRRRKTISILLLTIVLLSGAASSVGIISNSGSVNYEYESIRGKTFTIYGTGIYRHMSADVADQGIAQYYVTLFIGIPLLLILLWGYRRGSWKNHFILTGVTGYFFCNLLILYGNGHV